jgi:hypothetical protein
MNTKGTKLFGVKKKRQIKTKTKSNNQNIKSNPIHTKHARNETRAIVVKVACEIIVLE